MKRATALLGQMEEFQHWMAEHFGLDEEGLKFEEKKHKTSFMRRFAPDGVATGLLWSANIRTLRHTIEARTDKGAEEEIRLLFGQIAEIMRRGTRPVRLTTRWRTEPGSRAGARSSWPACGCRTEERATREGSA